MSRRRAITLIVILSLILSGIIFINYNMRESTKSIDEISSSKYKTSANKAFEDQNFYNCVVDAYNTENSKSVSYTTNLSDSQLQTIENISCESKGITSAKGISKLSNLINLNLSNNKLTSLDLDGNILLEELEIYDNYISKLDLNKNLNLQSLNASSNNINILVLPKTLSLATIDISGNKLRSLNLSFYKELYNLDVSRNNLNAIILPDTKFLTEIFISENNLTKLDVSSCTNLEYISASNNNISELILPNASLDDKKYLLKDLYIEHNNLSNLNISKYTNLEILKVNGNNISDINLNNNKKLVTLDVGNNKLKKLQIINNTNLEDLYAYKNKLISVRLGETNKKLSNLFKVDIQNNFLKTIDLSNLPNLEYLYADGNYIKNVDVSNNKKIDLNSLFYICPRVDNTFFDDSSLYRQVIEKYNVSLSEYNKGKPVSELMYSLSCDEKITTKQLSIITELSVYGYYQSYVDRTIYNIDLTELKKLPNLKKLYIPTKAVKKNINLSSLSNLEQFGFSSFDDSYTFSYTYTLNLSNQKWLTDEKLKSLLKQGTVRRLILGNNPNLKEIDLSGSKHLMSLTFSSAMTNVTSLNVSNTGLSSLDMTKLPNLTNLNASNSSLESIDNLNTATSLQTLNLTNNRISSLDVSKLTKLETLMISGQRNLQNEKVLSSLKLPERNVTSNKYLLKNLRIGNNNLTSLNLTNYTELETLFLYDTLIGGTLDLSNKNKLKSLSLANSKITELKLPKNSLTSIDTKGSQISELDLSYNPGLTTISIGSKILQTLNLSNVSSLTSTTLTNIVKSVPNITSLSLGNNKSLTKVSIGNFDNLKSVTIHTSTEGNDNISSININNNPKLTNITLGKLNNLTTLILNDNGLTSINGILYLKNLTELDLSNNKITSLNVSGLRKLKTLKVSNYSEGYDAVLKNITLPKNTNKGEYLLETLSIGNNLITGKLDLTNYKNLKKLYVYSSKIKEIELPHTRTLNTLSTAGSQIEKLNLSYNPGLTTITINSKALQELDLSNITSLNKDTLTNIVKSVPNITNLSLGNNKSLTGISLTNSESNSKLEKITIHTSSKDENDNLTWITINNYPNLKTLTLGRLKKLKGLGLSNNSLTTIWNLNKKDENGEYLPSITNINLNNNSMKSLDVSNLKSLQTLKVNNQRDNNNNKTFNSIKLPTSNNLYQLEVSDNNLKTIDLSGLSGLKNLSYISNPYYLGTTTVQIGQSVNLADSINTDNIKVNLNMTKKFRSAKPKENNKFNVDKDNKVTITEQGSYEYIVEFTINSSVATGTYTVKVSDIDLDIKTDYKISDENKYIYTGLDTNESTILNNITINSGYEKEIKDNKLIIKKNNNIVREYTIINIIKSPSNENNYNDYLSKDYIYTKISEFKSDYVKTNIDNQEGITKTIENTDNIYEFTIGYKGEKLKTYKILTIKNKKEDKYKINGKYVYIKGKYEENTIEVTNGIIEEEKDTLKVMYEDKEIDSIPELKIDFGELNVTGNNIVLKEEITYDDFIGKITLTNLATEIYKEEEKVTSGYIEKGMTLKVYSKDMGMEETYTITDEYINVDELEVDENGYVSKYELGTTYQDIQDNITTSGSVKFIDDSEKELSLSDIIRTGSKIIINTGTEEKEYTLVVYGDVNGDGEISIFDINEAIKYKDQDKENDCYKEAADVAKDGKIDIFDYNEIIKLKRKE